MRKIQSILSLIGGYMFIIFSVGEVKANYNTKISFRSPYDTIQTHFMLVNADYEGHTVNAGVVFFTNKYTSTTLIGDHEMACKLYNLFREKRIKIKMRTIPTNPDYIDPITKEHIYYLSPTLPQVYLIKEEGAWKYSPFTRRYIKGYTKSHTLRNLFYKFFSKTWCKKEILHIAIWQYLSLFTIILMIGLAYKIIPYFFRSIVNRYTKLPREQYVTVERLFFLFITILFIKMLVPTLFHLPRFTESFTSLLQITEVGVLMFLAYSFVKILQAWTQTTYHMNQNFILPMLLLFSTITKIIIVLIGFIIMLKRSGFETTYLIKSLSFTPLIIGIAGQDAIKNIFGSLMILIDKPFSVGDEIATDSIHGKVEEIGLRATLLRTKEGSISYIPNAKLADTQINNFDRRIFRVVALEIPLSYSQPLEKLGKFMEELKKIVKHQPFVNLEKTTFHLDKMHEQCLIVKCHIYLNTSQGDVEQECKNDILLHIIQLAQQLKLTIT